MLQRTGFVLSFFLFSLFPLTAQASPKFFSFWWWPSHWENQDFIPYYDNGTQPHNGQWNGTQWTPADWISMDTGRGEDLVEKWVRVGIIKRRYTRFWDNVPAVDVGPNFYHLSGLDKRRVMETLDAVYSVTDEKPGLFYVSDPGTGQIIGYYTKSGLVLQ